MIDEKDPFADLGGADKNDPFADMGGSETVKKKEVTPASPAQPTKDSATVSGQQSGSGVGDSFLAEANKAFKEGGQSGLEQGLTQGSIIGAKPADDESTKIKKSITKKIDAANKSAKEQSLKASIVNYLQKLTNHFGGTVAQEGEPTGEPVDIDVDIYEPIRLQTESLQPDMVSENVDPQLRERVVMKNSKLAKSATDEFNVAKPYIEGITKLSQVKQKLGQAQAEYDAATNVVMEQRAAIDADLKRARMLNPEKMVELGFTEGFEKSLEQTTIANSIADMYMKGDDDKVKNSLESLYADSVLFPQEETTGGMIGGMIGGQVKPLAVGFGLGALNPALGVVGGSAYYGRMNMGSSMIEAYATARAQGMDADDAYEVATKQAKVGFATGAAEGLVGMVTMGGKPVQSAVTETFKRAVKSTLKEAGVDGAVAGGLKAVENVSMQKLGLDVETDSGVMQEMAAEALFGTAMHMAMFGGKKVLGANYGTIINGIAKMPFNEIQAKVNEVVKAGVLDAAKGEQFLTEVRVSSEAQERLKGVDIPEKKQDTVIELQKQINQTEKDMENASPAVVPALEKKIEDLSAEMQVEAAIPLTAKEKLELNKLQTARDENKAYDKDRLKVLEKRQKAAEKVAEEKLEAEEKAKEEAIKRQQEEKAAEEQDNDIEAKKADIERRREEELKRFEGRRANSVVKYNPDGANTELTEKEIEEVEILINTAKEKGLSVDRTQRLLQANGFIQSLGNSVTAFREFLSARLSGEIDNRVNGEFLNTINAKYDAELEALSKPNTNETTPTKEVSSEGNSALRDVEAQKADIKIGKVSNTEYEVKSDGVYYKDKKLDNPKNLSHKELITEDIRRRKKEELNAKDKQSGKFKKDLDVYIIEKRRIIDEFIKNKGENLESIDGWNDLRGDIQELLFEGKFDEAKAKVPQTYEEKINAKYDAELDALEQPEAPTTPAVETPAETVSETTPTDKVGEQDTQTGIEAEPQAETIPEGVQNFEAALAAKTAPKKDKALKNFGEQEARAKELIENYDTNLQKLKDNGVEPVGSEAQILFDMISGKYDEIFGAPTKQPTTHSTKLQSAKERLAEAKRKREEIAKKKENLGAVKDPFQEAEEMAKADKEIFEAYVDVAKEFIKEVGGDIQAWAKEIGEEVNETLQKAWDEATKSGGRKKTITARRAYEGEFREDVKRELEKIGLTREVESQEQVEADAKAFIERVGLDAAVDAVRAKDIEGAHAMEILNSKIEDIEKQMLGETDPDKLIQLAREQSEAIDELDQLNVKYGRGSSYMNRIYAKSDLGYNVEKLISDYKKENDGEISPEVEAKFRELDKQLKETNKKLKEAEERLAEREAERAVANIKESVSRRKTRNKKDEAKQLIGEGLSDLADALGVKLMAVGDKRASIVTALSKIGRGLILNGEATLENVSQKVREYVNEKFGGKLNFDEYEEDFNTTIAEGAKTSGKIKIETQLIRDLVESGIDNIEDLVAAVKERIVVDYPNATDREIRDAITGYGKVINPTKDEVSVQIRKIKDIGRLISAIEDVENKKRPLKSGLQRDKLNEEQRRLRKQLREAMKDLPLDTETQEQQMRTALDAAKARIRNRIEELQKDIESGERVEKSKRTVEADQELMDLRREKDELQAIHDSMFGGNEPTYEQRIESAIKSAEKSIAELERKIAEGDLEPKKGKELIPTQELKELQDKRDSLQKELNKLRQDAKPKKTEAEIEEEKLNKAIEQKEKIRDELIEKISNQDISAKQRTPKSYDNDPRIIQLNAEIEVLNKKMRDLRNAQKIKKTDEQKAIDAIERQIKTIDDKIQAGGVDAAKKSKPTTAAIEAAKGRLNKKREELLKLKEETGQIEQKRLANAKKTVERRIAELQRRLKEGDFSKKEKKPIMEDTELTRLKAEKIRIKEEYDKEFYKAKLRNRTLMQRAKDYVWDAWGLTRALSATADLSFIAVQGWVNLLSHPIQSARAFGNAIKFMSSEARAEQWLNNLKSQEWYPTLKDSKLSITEPKAEMTAREELFNSGWTNVIWDVVGSPLRLAGDKAYQTWVNANPMKALERASVGYLDTIRVQRFLDGMQMLEMQGKTIQNDKQAYKNMADVINTFTGRASLGAGEQIAPQLTKVFFSPRNWASILKQTILLPRQIIKWQDGQIKPSVANKMAISDLSKALGLTSAMVMMAAAALNEDDDPETSVETDPTSSDFGKLKLGRTRVDPWGGRIQQVILVARLITDSINRKGKSVKLGSQFGAPTKEELIMEQAFNKLSPSAQILHRYLTSKPTKDGKARITKYGEEYEFSQDVLDRMHPIIYDTVKELLEDDPNALDGLLIFYAILGGGVNTYQEKKQVNKAGSTKKPPAR